MNNITKYICLMLLPLVFSACNNKPQPAEQLQTTIEKEQHPKDDSAMTGKPHINNQASEQVAIKMIHDFYNEWIPLNCGLPLNKKAHADIQKRYLSKRLIKWIKDQELDYDPFLNAQDSDITWLERLTVSKDILSNGYIVKYTDEEHENGMEITLMVAREDDALKIDAVTHSVIIPSLREESVK